MRLKNVIPLLLLMLWALPAYADVVVIVRREVQPTGNYVRVCDIARVDGPKELVREIAQTVLGPAPSGGETREITRWDIQSRLAEMGIVSRVQFSGNDVVRVLGSGVPPRRYHDASEYQPLGDTPDFAMTGSDLFGAGSTREDARMAARRALRGENTATAKPPPKTFAERPVQAKQEDFFSGLAPDAKLRVSEAIGEYFSEKYRSKRSDIEVGARLLSANAGIAPDAFEIRVAEADGHLPGRAKVRLKVRDSEDAPERFVDVVADAEVTGQALVAIRNVKRGETLKASDVAVKRVKMQAGKTYLPPRVKSAEGREVKRNLNAGDVILDSDAPVGAAIKRGQYLVVDSSGRGWSMVAKAKALGEGAVGDIISAEDLDTKKKYLVRITGRDRGSLVVDRQEELFNRK